MRFHGGRRGLLDFSVNTNPLGPPEDIAGVLRECLSPATLSLYPDYEYRDLRDSLCMFYKCSPEEVVPVNGAAEGINLVATVLRPRRVYVVEPSYGEYSMLSGVLGYTYVPIDYRRCGDEFCPPLEEIEGSCRDEEGLFVVTNPSNPLGTYIEKRVLADIAERCRSRFLVDEAYIELCETCDYRDPGYPENVVVVRSMGKFLGLPGLRLGALFSRDRRVLEKIDALRSPWNINSVAECLGTRVFREYREALERFIEVSRDYIGRERRRVSTLLEEIGFRVYKSVVNFFLARSPVDPERVYRALEERGVYVRRADTFRGLDKYYMRIAVRRREENDVLVSILREVVYGVLERY